MSKNKQTTSGAEGREAVPVGCLGSTSAIQSDPLGCEGNGRESIMGHVCLLKDVCGCDSSRSPRGGPPGTRVHHLGSHGRLAPEAEAAEIQIPRPWTTALLPNCPSCSLGLCSFFEGLPDTSGEQPRLGTPGSTSSSWEHPISGRVWVALWGQKGMLGLRRKPVCWRSCPLPAPTLKP